MMESESNSESSDQEIHQKEDDAYAEDDLPDLVLGIKFWGNFEVKIHQNQNLILCFDNDIS